MHNIIKAYKEHSRNCTTQRASAEQEAFAVFHNIQVNLGQKSPLHELEIQIHSTLGQSEHKSCSLFYYCVKKMIDQFLGKKYPKFQLSYFLGSMELLRLANLGPSLARSFLSQPSHWHSSSATSSNLILSITLLPKRVPWLESLKHSTSISGSVAGLYISI